MEDKNIELSDASIHKLADALLERGAKKLYFNTGKGVINWMSKIGWAVIVYFAVYGYAHGWFR